LKSATPIWIKVSRDDLFSGFCVHTPYTRPFKTAIPL
jgi:hypothetical protein